MIKKSLKNVICTLLTVTLFASLSVMSVMADEFEVIDIDFEDNTLGVITTTGMQTPTIVTVAKGTNEANKAIKLGSSWSGSIDTGMTMGEEGVYELSFSMMSNATQYQVGQTDRDKNLAVFLNKGTTTAAIIKNGYIRQSLDAKSSWNGNGTMFAVSAGEWLDVKLIIDTKTNTVVSATYTQGANTATVENISLGSNDYTTLYLYNNATTPSYVDDIKVKPYVTDEGDDENQEDNEDKKFTGIDVDFEDNTITGVGGVTEESLETVARGTNANNKALKIGQSWSGTIDTGIKADSGIYEISFSLYPETITGNNAVFFKDKTQAAVLVTYTNNNYVKQSMDTSNGSWNAKWVFDSKVGEWIDVLLVIDTTTDTVTSATYTQGNKSITVTQTAANQDLIVSAANYAQLILYGKDGDSCYIDDIAIKKVMLDPEIGMDSITLTDVYGNVVIVDDNETVTPAIDTITFDFKTELLAETLEDITFKDSNGDTVFGTSVIDAEAGLYTFDTEGFLKPDETYTITIPGTIQNANNIELGEEFIYEFTTKAGEVLVETLSLCDFNGKRFDTLESMSSEENAIAKLRYLNTTETDGEFVCVISYYKNGLMTFAEVAKSNSVDKSSKGEINVEFKIPDIQGITDVRIFVVDNNVDGIPVGEVFNPFA